MMENLTRSLNAFTLEDLSKARTVYKYSQIKVSFRVHIILPQHIRLFSLELSVCSQELRLGIRNYRL